MIKTYDAFLSYIVNNKVLTINEVQSDNFRDFLKSNRFKFLSKLEEELTTLKRQNAFSGSTPFFEKVQIRIQKSKSDSKAGQKSKSDSKKTETKPVNLTPAEEAIFLELFLANVAKDRTQDFIETNGADFIFGQIIFNYK